MLVPQGGGKPLVVDLPLPQPAPRSLAQTSYVDLTSHPYAGLMVTCHLEARDAIGQVGVSRDRQLPLPARIFTDPLARALIEQRQNLATADAAGPQDRGARRWSLTIDADRFYDGKHDIFLASAQRLSTAVQERQDRRRHRQGRSSCCGRPR